MGFVTPHTQPTILLVCTTAQIIEQRWHSQFSQHFVHKHLSNWSSIGGACNVFFPSHLAAVFYTWTWSFVLLWFDVDRLSTRQYNYDNTDVLHTLTR